MNDTCAAEKLREWLGQAVEAGASDLHLVAGYPPVLRLHGDLVELPGPPLEADEARELLRPVCPPAAFDRLAAKAGLESGAALIDRARSGDPDALRLLDEAANALGTALVGAVALLDPQRVLVTGGVAEAFDVLGPAVLSVLHRQLPPHLRDIALAVGSFGAGASLAGAGIAAFKGETWEHLR